MGVRRQSWRAGILPLLLLSVALPLRSSDTPPLTAAEIMSRVAKNQDRAQTLRTAFVYNQNVLIRFLRKNGKLAREEVHDFTVTPTPKGFEKKRNHFSGKYELNGQEIAYDEPHYHYKDLDIDGELVSELAEETTNEGNSRDGIAGDLFPLTAKEQQKYVFALQGTDTYGGREVYRITFKPVTKGSSIDFDEGTPWAGEVLVDKEEFQPVLVTTRLARGIPFWVRTFLGTNLKYLGFKLTYTKVERDVWFPEKYGGEFDVTGVFFYKRKIGISMVNSGFQRAEITTRVTYDSAEKDTPKQP